MKFTLAWPCLTLASAILLACCAATPAATPTTISLWKGGDTGLDDRLNEAVERALRASSDFTLAQTDEAVMRVTAPSTNADVRHGRFMFEVSVASGASDAVTQRISCREANLDDCGNKVVKVARSYRRSPQ